MIYIIPLIALIAIFWSSRNAVKKLLIKEKVALASKSEFCNIINKPYIVSALSLFLVTNHGTKQDETTFRNNGKIISLSESYKNIQAEAFA